MEENKKEKKMVTIGGSMMRVRGQFWHVEDFLLFECMFWGLFSPKWMNFKVMFGSQKIWGKMQEKENTKEK